MKIIAAMVPLVLCLYGCTSTTITFHTASPEREGGLFRKARSLNGAA